MRTLAAIPAFLVSTYASLSHKVIFKSYLLARITVTTSSAYIRISARCPPKNLKSIINCAPRPRPRPRPPRSPPRPPNPPRAPPAGGAAASAIVCVVRVWESFRDCVVGLVAKLLVLSNSGVRTVCAKALSSCKSSGRHESSCLCWTKLDSGSTSRASFALFNFS